jgi:hypothetical protein
MKKFYAVECWSGRHTTTGTPNERTGRMSNACSAMLSPLKQREITG